jgi:ribonuclease-3 family protein
VGFFPCSLFDIKLTSINESRGYFDLREINDLQVTPTEIERVSPAAWAYVGDAVYELYFRSYFLLPAKRLHNYHQKVVAKVRAEAQAQDLALIKPYLTNTELEILRRGRNAAFGCPKRLDPEVYQQATSLEALIGYLYLTDRQRLSEIFTYLINDD